MIDSINLLVEDNEYLETVKELVTVLTSKDVLEGFETIRQSQILAYNTNEQLLKLIKPERTFVINLNYFNKN